ncbi:MAG: hypothetical protein U0Y82_16230 [Thermoleophilia bacterium]
MPDPSPSRTPRHADRISRMKTGVVLGSAAALAAVGGLIATSGSGRAAQASAAQNTADGSQSTVNPDRFTGSDDGQPVIVYDPQTNSYYQVPSDGSGAQQFAPGGNVQSGGVQGGPMMRSGGS